ncbi:MAG: histidine kinase [Bacteroidota bacterium]
MSKLGSLTRSVLENSIGTKVLLRDEIKLLNSYLELESLRFDDVFEYKIIVSENLDTNTTEIPFMIVQPFIQNAIIHGLNKKQEN